jgi:rubrerythrin
MVNRWAITKLSRRYYLMFGNPFSANVERKMTKEELVQAIRADLSGELEAIYGYDAHVQATDDPVAKAVLSDIRDEERAHMGELLTLLKYLDPSEGVHYKEGKQEVMDELKEMGITAGELFDSSTNNECR